MGLASYRDRINAAEVFVKKLLAALNEKVAWCFEEVYRSRTLDLQDEWHTA